MDDLSVDHAATIGRLRTAQDISGRAADGTASTEDLRQAMIHYRTLFDDLVGDPAEVPHDATEPVPAVPPADVPVAGSVVTEAVVTEDDVTEYDAPGRLDADRDMAGGDLARPADVADGADGEVAAQDAAGPDSASLDEPGPGQPDLDEPDLDEPDLDNQPEPAAASRDPGGSEPRDDRPQRRRCHRHLGGGRGLRDPGRLR